MSINAINAALLKANADINQLESGSFSDTSVNIAPNVTSLANVTAVNVVSTTSTYYYGTDFSSGWFPSFESVSLEGTSDDMRNAASQISAGDIVELGPWASNDGNPAYLTVSQVLIYSTSIEIYYSSSSSNLNGGGMSSTGDYVSFPSYATDVVTDNAGLVLSQQYFQIGDLTPFRTEDVTVSGGTITFNGNIASSFIVGMVVAETSYTTTPTLTVYDPNAASYVSRNFVHIASSYRHLETIFYSSSSTFVKANYPDAKVLRVTVVGGGGGSAAVRATGSGQVSLSGGGGPGGCIVVWADVSKLAPSVTVTVGAGGAAGSSSSLTSGSGGGYSQFSSNSDALFVYGGGGSSIQPVQTPPYVVQSVGGSGTTLISNSNGTFFKIEAVSAATGGDFSFALSSTSVVAGGGGGYFLGASGRGIGSTSTAFANNGSVINVIDVTNNVTYTGRGGGGGGRANGQSRNAYSGSSGNPGLVIVEVLG